MQSSKPLLFIIFCVLFSCMATDRISNVNLAFEYSSAPNPFVIESEIVHEKDSSLLFLKITRTPGRQEKDKEILSKSLIDSLNTRLVVRLKVMSSYESKKTLFADTFTLDKSENNNDLVLIENKYQKFFSFRIPRFKNQNSLLGMNISEVKYPVASVSETFKEVKNISQIIVHSKTIYLPIQEENINTTQYFLFKNPESQLPIFRNYLRVNQPFMIDIPTIESIHFPVEVHFFAPDFIPAPPPMASVQKENEEKIKANPGNVQSLESKELFMTNTGQIEKISKEGLYLFVARKPGSNDEIKTSVLVVNTSYPHIEEAVNMISPLIYLSTKEEYLAFKDTVEKKKMVDDFWLKIARDKNHARNMIREFYSRVEQANFLFTSHKEGWKTDRGMIFIIFGEPQSVYRTNDTEVWEYFYQLDFQNIAFKFIKRENIFSLNHYEMLRSVSYTELWYSAVEQWRTGVLQVREY